MKHIFVSHARDDEKIADRLALDLRNAGHDTRVDTRELSLGDDIIDFINKGVEDAHTIIILYSKHTPQASWQKLEINSAIWNEVMKWPKMVGDASCFVLTIRDCLQFWGDVGGRTTASL